MTTPQQPPPQSDPAADTAAALAVASTLQAAVEMLAPVYLRIKISRIALQSSLGVAMAMPPEVTGFHGAATAHAVRMNLARRAAFVLASSRRMQTAIEQARSAHDPALFLDALAAERRYYGQHLAASWQRNRAASAIDSQAMMHGRLLGWYTMHTATTTPECLQADHHNFWADREPSIGWPGMAHPGCRCYPGPPIPGAPLVGTPALSRIRRRRVPVNA